MSEETAPHTNLKTAWSELTKALLDKTTTPATRKTLMIKVDRLIVQLDVDVELFKQMLIDDYAAQLYLPTSLRSETCPTLMGN